jgi:hypothetical protein
METAVAPSSYFMVGNGVTYMVGRYIKYVVIIAFLGLGGFTWGQYNDKIKAIGRFAEQVERIQGLTKENGEIKIEKRQLTEELQQAYTISTEKDKTIEEALNSLKVSNDTAEALRHELVGALERVGEVEIRVDVRSDTIEVERSAGITYVNDDWLSGALVEDKFTYNFLADIYYINTTTVLRDGTRHIIEYGELRSTRGDSKMKLDINSKFVVNIPDQNSFSFNPTVHLGASIPHAKPNIGMSAFSRGKTTEGKDVRYRFPYVGLTLEKEPYLVVSPVLINIGAHLPLFHNLYVSGVGMYNRGWIVGGWVGTTL